jgi:hypothetical protein
VRVLVARDDRFDERDDPRLVQVERVRITAG